jgi:ElaB/YqjD/DUF883 family membrane-anchored ribosome-binding protein
MPVAKSKWANVRVGLSGRIYQPFVRISPPAAQIPTDRVAARKRRTTLGHRELRHTVCSEIAPQRMGRCRELRRRPATKLETAMNRPVTQIDPATTEDVVARTAQSAHEMVDRVAENATPAIERLREGVNEAADAIKSGAEDFNEMQRRWIDACRSRVRDYPFVSVAIAVAAGVVLSRLIARGDAASDGRDASNEP